MDAVAETVRYSIVGYFNLCDFPGIDGSVQANVGHLLRRQHPLSSVPTGPLYLARLLFHASKTKSIAPHGLVLQTDLLRPP